MDTQRARCSPGSYAISTRAGTRRFPAPSQLLNRAAYRFFGRSASHNRGREAS